MSKALSSAILVLLLLIITGEAKASSLDNVMPRPKYAVLTEDNGFNLQRRVRFFDPTYSPVLQQFISESGLIPDSDANAVLTVKLREIEESHDYQLPHYPSEAYTIKVSADTISISAQSSIGVTRAAQTLRLMAADSPQTLESVIITDWPAFKVRGFMHDVGRSFISLAELKREIDLLSRFKVNTFHWHLTDNTGWRLEITSYPELTGDKAITRFPGQFYSQRDARELQDYAAARGVIVIPEIDLPGHSGPFERTLGHSMLSDEGKTELKVILSEVAELFDKAPYIHIGGDEKPFPDSYLMEMIDFVHSLGKKVVIWNQYNYYPARSVDPQRIACDLTTNWATAGKLSKGVPNIDMRYNYTNHFDTFADVAGIFKSSIFGVPEGNSDVAGIISATWNDTMVPTEEDIVRMNNVYANILASNERAWMGGGEEYIESGGTTIPNSGTVYDEFADWERRFLHHKATTLSSTAHLIPYVKQTNVRWAITDPIPNGGNRDISLPPEQWLESDSMPRSINVDNSVYGIHEATGAGIYLRHIWHPIVKGLFENPSDSTTVYAWTYVYSPIERDAGALIEFYTYSRSGNERAPESGCWDRRGSRIWMNGIEIAAPIWEQPNAVILQDQIESGLTNENLTARQPITLRLQQGWNKVFVKLPHVGPIETGRDKWQFTFVLTDPTGTEAIPDLIYSPFGCDNSLSDKSSNK